MEIDFTGDYLSAKSSVDGDICEIIDEGYMEFNKNFGRQQFSIHIRKNSNKDMVWSPNNEAGRLLQQAFGKDSKLWIGKKFQIFHLNNSMKIKPIIAEKPLDAFI